jgi:hypothetical protein
LFFHEKAQRRKTRDEGRDRKKDIRKTGNQGAGKQEIRLSKSREAGYQGTELAGQVPLYDMWIPVFTGMTN